MPEESALKCISSGMKTRFLPGKKTVSITGACKKKNYAFIRVSNFYVSSVSSSERQSSRRSCCSYEKKIARVKSCLAKLEATGNFQSDTIRVAREV